MRLTHLLLMISMLLPALAQDGELKTIGEVKQWGFQTDRGEVGVKLSVLNDPPPMRSPRAVVSFERGPTPSLSEEGRMLTSVIREMPSLGYDPRILQSVVTELRDSEYQGGVAQAISKAGIERFCSGRKHCVEGERVATKYLRSIDAFRQLDAVLQANGLRRADVFVDDLKLRLTEQQALSNSSNSNRTAWVAYVFVIVEPVH